MSPLTIRGLDVGGAVKGAAGTVGDGAKGAGETVGTGAQGAEQTATSGAASVATTAAAVGTQAAGNAKVSARVSEVVMDADGAWSLIGCGRCARCIGWLQPKDGSSAFWDRFNANAEW